MCNVKSAKFAKNHIYKPITFNFTKHKTMQKLQVAAWIRTLVYWIMEQELYRLRHHGLQQLFLQLSYTLTQDQIATPRTRTCSTVPLAETLSNCAIVADNKHTFTFSYAQTQNPSARRRIRTRPFGLWNKNLPDCAMVATILLIFFFNLQDDIFSYRRVKIPFEAKTKWLQEESNPPYQNQQKLHLEAYRLHHADPIKAVHKVIYNKH